MASITDFKAQLGNGGARSNQFMAYLTMPNWVNAGLPASQQATFLCKAAQLPASTVADVEVQYRGRAVHFAGERSYQPWVVTIINSDFRIRNAFEQWQHGLQEYNTTGGGVNPSRYQTQMEVRQLNRDGSPMKQYSFHNAYPTTIGQIQVGYDQPNEIEQFEVEFAYDYFIPSDVGVSGSPSFALAGSIESVFGSVSLGAFGL